MWATRVHIVVVILVALSTSADADPPAPRDESTATLLSVAGTLGPALVLGAAIGQGARASELTGSTVALGIVGIAGLYVFPSAGHWYSGERFTRGFGYRTGGMVIVGLGLVTAITSAGCHCFCSNSNGDLVLFGIGGALVLGGAIHDIVTAGARARSVNARMQPTIAPMPLRGGGGVSLALMF